MFLGREKSWVWKRAFQEGWCGRGVRPRFEPYNKRVILSGKWDLFTQPISMHLETRTVQGREDISKMPSTEPEPGI